MHPRPPSVMGLCDWRVTSVVCTCPLPGGPQLLLASAKDLVPIGERPPGSGGDNTVGEAGPASVGTQKKGAPAVCDMEVLCALGGLGARPLLSLRAE